MWCQKRITYPALAVKFGDGKHRFYLESVCAVAIDQGQKLCNECLNKVAQTRTQDSHTFAHGLVSGPYTKESHIYNSDWYKAKVATYGAPADAIVEVAMQAQSLARAGKGIRKPEDVTVAVAVATPSAVAVAAAPVVEEPTKKRGRKPAEKKEKAEPKPRAPKRALKTSVASEPIAAPMNVLVPIQQVPLDAPVETMDEPIAIRDIIQVVLRPFGHGSVRYWRDGERDKVYKRTADGKRGPYVGRWCSQSQSIISDAPDSDQD
jgi:N-methylhydantoinase A/oxoprolinase/acetone carboxylase beta subunit